MINRVHIIGLLQILLFWFYAVSTEAQDVINISGIWDFAIGDETILSANDKAAKTLPRRHYDDYVELPGSMMTNGKGDDVGLDTRWTGTLYDSSYYFNPAMEDYRQPGQMKFPFFLTPSKHYVGAAWYRKKVYVPKDWRGRRITLFMERPHIETTVYVNGFEAGHQSSLSVPHRYDVTRFMKAGHQNEIAVRVYNGIENVGVGQDSHSVTDQTQGNWNGITGRIELQAQWKKLNIKRIRIIPEEKLKMFKVLVELENHIPYLRVFPLYDYYVSAEVRPVTGKSAIDDAARPIRSSRQELDGEDHVTFSFFTHGDLVNNRPSETDIKPWDEFHPHLYKLTIKAGDDVWETTFGLRNISTDGRQLCINGRPLFLRGTVESCLFPETGYPPTDKEDWLKVMRKCKEWGLNHVRFHSYCPPDAAFQAADQLGIYLQPEGPSWPNHGVKLLSGQVIDSYLLEETKRIVDEYGHHPSFVMMSAGNEPAGNWVAYCNDWVRQMHDYDSTRLYCGASVGGGWAWDDGSEFHVKGGARGLDWHRNPPQSADDYYSQIEYPRNYPPLPHPELDGKGFPNNSPIIAHEQGQWCVFPDFREIPQYTGVYKAANLEIFRDLLERGGMAQQAGKFLMASGRLQALCYKYEIERNLRTPGYAGFQLLGLTDYSGQGSAFVGPLNVHWEEKGYITHDAWHQFCNSLVVLARFPRFVYTSADTLRVPIEMMNAVYGDLKPVLTTFDIVQSDTLIIFSDTLTPCPVPIGKNIQLGEVVMPLNRITKPSKLTLTVIVGNTIQNHWDFWVYPETLGKEDLETCQEAILISDSLSAAALDMLRAGGTVLLTAAGRVTLGSDIVQHYLPVFWNTSWFKMRPPHTTGAYIDKSHPLFKYGFPTDDWGNLNWWELLNRAQVMNLMELPADYQPPIQPIDTWHVSRKLGMLIEARVLAGRLLMTTMDITNSLDSRIVARQMRHAILEYMRSPDFQPTLTLEPEVIRHFYTRQAPPVNMFTNDSPDELKPKIKEKP